MPSSHPSRFSATLALVRLLLVFIALCLVFTQIDLAQRLVRDQSIGLPSPLFSRDSLPPPSTIPFLGINLDSASLTAVEQLALFAELAEVGFGWVRVRVGWDQIEPSEGNFAWQRLDETLAALADADLMPVLLLDGSPAWARVPEKSALAP